MEGLDELIAHAELGKQARDFLDSDLGKCLMGMAQQEIDDAQEQLESVAPTDTEKIRDLQNKAKLGRLFDGWLKELLSKGDNAIDVFQQQTGSD